MSAVFEECGIFI